jgi:hypothetical protein
MSKTFSEKILRKSTKISMSFFLDFFVLSLFQVFLCDGSSKTSQKTFYKKIVSKSFYKKIDKNSQTDFFSVLFHHVFGRFSVRGVKKHDKKISQKNLTNPGTFLASEEPTNHVGVRHFFFECPLSQPVCALRSAHSWPPY